MVVQHLSELAKHGPVSRDRYESSATASHSATDQVIAHFLTRSIQELSRHGFAEEDGRSVLVALCIAAGRREWRMTRGSPQRRMFQRIPFQGFSDRWRGCVVRRLDSGAWEIVHDLVARNAIEGLTGEEDRRFKQAREILDAKALGFDQYHGVLTPLEIKDLWTRREQLPPKHLGHKERAVILLTMATLERMDVNAAYSFGKDDEDAPIGFTYPSPVVGARLALAFGIEAGGTSPSGSNCWGNCGDWRSGGLCAACLSLGSSGDVGELVCVLKGSLLVDARLAEETIACIASLSTEANLPFCGACTRRTSPPP